MKAVKGIKTIIGFLKRKWVIHLVGVVALCALIWFAGPKFAYANKAPLEPDFNRLLAILAVIIIYTVYSLITQARANKKDQQLMDDLAAPQVDPAQVSIDEAKSEEAATVRSKLEEALQKLKQTQVKGRRDKQYLYEWPWYIIIGFPGCGKTTLLVNSGLKFPLSEHMDTDEIPGVGGTRNCDWLFAEEAIFIDTAGRYTSQDSHQPVDAAAWRNFLDLIKKYRPRRPINGVLVTMSMDDLIQKTDEERRRHAKAIRQRIIELYQVLNVQFPIYMLFTKCDLIAGFTDFFAQLNREERAQVWGETFPGTDSNQTGEYITRFDANFDELLRRLSHRAFRRIQEERDVRRRSLILDFPHQMALLRPSIKGFLQDTFVTSRFDEFAPLLRGVYFTSGTQVGTPIDRVMGLLAATYGLDRQEPPKHRGKGKSFFITRLLKEVVFPEAGLAGSDLRVERRKRRLKWASYASLLVLITGVIVLWSVSYARNKNAMGQIKTQIQQYKKASKETREWDTGMRSLLVRLNTMEAANAVYTDHSWWTGFGLYQGDQLQDGIKQVYRQLLKNNLLPVVKARLEQRIYARMNANSDIDLSVLYELLKVYLMLGQPERMVPTFAEAWINSDWKQVFAGENQIQDELRHHSNALLKLSLEPIQLNDPLIAQTQRILNAQPLYKQIYAHLQTKAMVGHDFRLGDVLPPHSDKVFTTANGQRLEELTIPWLYTADGYRDFFKKQGLESVRKALKENWVLDKYAKVDERRVYHLHDELQMHYFNQYKKQWHSLLNNLQVKKAKDMDEEIIILGELSGPETPLRPLLDAVNKNTNLTAAQETETAGAAPALMRDALPGHGSRNYLRELYQEFEDLNKLVIPVGKFPPPLDNMLKSLSDVREFMDNINISANSNEEALEIAMQRMSGAGANDTIKNAQREFDRLPEPFKSWCSSLTSSAWKSTLAGAKSGLNAKWKTDVMAPYIAGLQGRYPLYRDSWHDATMVDFSRFFMPNGIIDRFFQENLEKFVDTTRHNWRMLAMDNQGLRLSSSVLRQFQYAAKISDNFFPPGGSSPSVEFRLKAVKMDTNVIRSFRINLEGQPFECKYVIESKKLNWPGPRANAGVRLIFKTVDNREFIHTEEGPWAWLKILDKANIERTETNDRFNVTFRIDDFTATFELQAYSVYNPFGLLKELQNFRCPESL